MFEKLKASNFTRAAQVARNENLINAFSQGDAEALEALSIRAELAVPPRPRSASEKLAENLQRNIDAYSNREKELRSEIAAREAELADVLKASAAACKARDALVDADMAEAMEAELTTEAD